MSTTSVRTLILGIDPSGRIVQHDQEAPEILRPPDATLLGARLGDLVAGPAREGSPLSELLEAARSGRESTAVLAVRTQRGRPADAVATVQPMRSGDPGLSALVILRMPPPTDERFLDPSLMRHALLDDTFRQVGATLDLDQMTHSLISFAVPHFCNAASLLLLDSLVTGDEAPAPAQAQDGTPPVRRMAHVADDGDPAWASAFPVGEVFRYPPGGPFTACATTLAPVRESYPTAASAAHVAHVWRRGPVAGLLSGASTLVLPLIARGVLLGVVVCTRKAGFRAFDAYETEIGMEYAARAAVFIDNARQFSRERATALTLQRSLLPSGLSAPDTVEVGHRYLPGSQLVEVGGDWYDSIAMPGGRVALVVGDVAGHGVQAAVTMGRLRTAIRTLAMLEMSPAESLEHLNELMLLLGGREPHFATCAYAVYDTVEGTCEIASAGHLPPLLVRPDGSSEFLDVRPSPPLGIGDGMVQSQTFAIDNGSLLVLYTDGLVESRDCDIDDGLRRLRSGFGPGAASHPVDDLCKTVLAGAYAEHQRDDITVLVARLRGLAADRRVSWTLPAEPTSAGRARALLRDPLRRWRLEDLLPTAQLLVSELVTNALRYTEGPLTLRLVLDQVLTCEVLDNSAALPRIRHAARDDERGRGLPIVKQLSQRWGARRTPSGKTVWCELPVPRG